VKVRARLPEALVQVSDEQPVILPPEDDQREIPKLMGRALAKSVEATEKQASLKTISKILKARTGDSSLTLYRDQNRSVYVQGDIGTRMFTSTLPFYFRVTDHTVDEWVNEILTFMAGDQNLTFEGAWMVEQGYNVTREGPHGWKWK